MDLLCTENIMKDNESENVHTQSNIQQQQDSNISQQKQQQQHRNTEPQQAKSTTYSIVHSSDSCSSSCSSYTSLSSSSSLSSSASSASSGYNSSSNSCSSFHTASIPKTTNSSTDPTTTATTDPHNTINNIESHHGPHLMATDNVVAVNVVNQPHAEEQQTQAYYFVQQHDQQQQQQQQQLTQQQQQQQQYYSDKNKDLHHHIISRSLDIVNTAKEDPTFLSDRCLENALKSEEKRPKPSSTYFKTVQVDITPPMRKVVVEWMMELCAEEKCQEEVVLLSIIYMDRFLSTKSVRKTHLQILAAACLLIASKLREPSCRALSADILVFYTDNSIYKSDLIKWELYVLSRLGWDLSSVTPLDFLELLLIRLPIRNPKCPDLTNDKVRQHAQAFISLAAKEHYFSLYSASTIASASIAAALNGLNWHIRTGENMRFLINRLTDLTSVKLDYLQDCMMKMEHIFEEHSRKLQPYMITVEPHIIDQQQQHSQLVQTTTHFNQQQQQRYHGASPLQHHVHYHGGNAAAAVLPDLTQTCKMQANAQKDVHELKF